MVSFLCSEIGRGHPFYLDGLVRALRENGCGDLIGRRADVFEVSRGLSLLAWRGVRAWWHLSGRSELTGGVSGRVRRRFDYGRDSFRLRALRRDLRTWAGASGVVVVDHPLLAACLRGRADVWYMHGEVVAPDESIVPHAARIFVPTDEVAQGFIARGVAASRLVVTGLCIEKELAENADEWARERRARIESGAPLTIAFFSSGAEPKPHAERLCAAARSMAEAGNRAVMFAARGGRLEAALRRRTGAGFETVPFTGRRELDDETARRFGSFDVFVAPPHERTNWALGLSIPVLLLEPDFGPFAPRNRALLLQAGVAAEIGSLQEARSAAKRLERLRRSGALLRMLDNGRARPLDGFVRAARFVADACRRQERDARHAL